MKNLVRFFFGVAIVVQLAWVGLAHSGYTYETLDVPDARYTQAYGLNNAGQVVGDYWETGNNNVHGFLYSGGIYTTFDPPDAVVPYSTIPTGINAWGQIVGSYDSSVFGNVGFLKIGDQYSILDVPDSMQTVASSIIDAGQVVGTYCDTQSGIYGFIYSGTTYTTLSVPGSTATYAYGINNSGQIVGLYFDSSTGKGSGFLYSEGAYTTLDFPGAWQTEPMGINNSGQIVGFYYDGAYHPHGFLYSGGMYTEIAVPGAYITFVYGINDSGQISGIWQTTTECHGFLATPVSIPGDFIPADFDVDGSDLAKLIANPSLLDIATFAQNFGKSGV